MGKLFLLFLLSFLQSCQSQNPRSVSSPTRIHVSDERSDSLAINIPPAKGFINDFTNLFSISEVKYLDSIVSTFEKQTSVEIAVATVDSSMVTDEDFDEYSLVMLRKWGVGKKEKNNGILIAISPDLRRMRIQNGYGIEKLLSDSDTKEIIDSVFIPKFSNGQYFSGTRDGILTIISRLQKSRL